MKNETFELEGFIFKVFHVPEDELQLLNEAKEKGRPLIGTYTYDIHKPHNPKGEYHIHLRDKEKEILSMNKVSGTAHDGYHGTRIPNKAFKALKQKLPDWNWPKNQILESLNYTYILTKNELRPVQVFRHRDHDLNSIDEFVGFFHQFGEDPFLAGGGDGWKQRTVALIETEKGEIKKVPVTNFRFLDAEF